MSSGSMYGRSNGTSWLACTTNLFLRLVVLSIDSNCTLYLYVPVTLRTRNGPVVLGSSLLNMRCLRVTNCPGMK